MAGAAIDRGRMSEPHIDPTEGDLTLEPRRPGLSFLGWEANSLGLLMIVIGGVMLLRRSCLQEVCCQVLLNRLRVAPEVERRPAHRLSWE